MKKSFLILLTLFFIFTSCTTTNSIPTHFLSYDEQAWRIECVKTTKVKMITKEHAAERMYPEIAEKCVNV